MFLGILSITIALIALLALIMSQFLVSVLVSLQIDDWEKLQQLYSYYNLISLESALFCLINVVAFGLWIFCP